MITSEKDFSNALISFIEELYSHRDDITAQVKKHDHWSQFYHIHILIHIKSTDGLWKTINKGIDRGKLMDEVEKYFNLTRNDCRVICQNVYED